MTTQNERERKERVEYLDLRSTIEDHLRRVIDDKEICYHADKILEKVKVISYRLIPELTPLSEGEVVKASFNTEGVSGPNWQYMAVAQAQLNHTLKQIKEG